MSADTSTCPPLADRITKSLLGYGVIAGPIYIVAVAAQAATREGFDPTRHAASQLANGDLGWIQIVICLVAGCFVVAAHLGKAGERGWAWFSRFTGAFFAATFAFMASGSGGPTAILLFTAAVVLAWAWLSALSLKLYKAVDKR